MQKQLVDSLTADDYAEMGVTPDHKETDLKYSSMLLPLVEIYDRCEERKKGSRADIAAV